jgi:hypothetical protein
MKFNKSLSQDYGLSNNNNNNSNISNSNNNNNNSRKGNKFRVLKSNILVDGIRYKISVSLLLLC